MRTFVQSKTGMVLIVFIAIVAFFLVTEHSAHLTGPWPVAFIFLCLGMHLVVPGGMPRLVRLVAFAGHGIAPAP